MLVSCRFPSAKVEGFVPDKTPLDRPFALRCASTGREVIVLGQFCKTKVTTRAPKIDEAQKVASIYEAMVLRGRAVSVHGFAEQLGSGLIRITTGLSKVIVSHAQGLWTVREGYQAGLDTNLEVAAGLVVSRGRRVR